MKTFLFYLSIWCCCTHCIADFKFNEIKPPSTEIQQTKAAKDVIDRLIPNNSDKFQVEVDFSLALGEKDQFTVVKIGDVIKIKASSGVAATWGFHYYIKNYCNAHIGWQNEQLNLPASLPKVNLTVVAQDRFRYHQNVCTASYSFAWWGEKEWEKHIDWMALNGINLALASNGQEAIWKRVYKKFNLTDDEIDEHFAGPAFLSWQRMANMRGWGGPLTDNWHDMSISLEHFIIEKMNLLGITPVLPAFSGQVPKGFSRLFPDAKFHEIEEWNGFTGKYCCPLFLDPLDPLFQTIGGEFLSELIGEFGTFHIYNSDPFNEIKPPSDEENFLELTSQSIFKSMESVDSNAFWLLQNWMFVHDSAYWTPDKVKTFLTAVPLGRVIILDLQSEQWPKYSHFNNYYGQPYIWCMLHNFGGTLGMFGSSETVNKNVYEARNDANSSMIGIGLTMEGINQNYIIYDLMLESGLRNSSLDLINWAKNYTTRRYGSHNADTAEAWNILLKTVYNYNLQLKMRGKYAITKRPSLNYVPWAWYSSKDLLNSWDLLIKCNVEECSSSGYKHDVVDLTRQVLQYRGDQIYPLVIKAFKQRDLDSLRGNATLFLTIFKDLERLLASNEDFLLGKWIESAKRLAKNAEEKTQYEFNARNQITLWGPDGQIVDYAIKQWAGLVEDYLAPRWKVFLKSMEKSLVEDTKFNITATLDEVFDEVEHPFNMDRKIYPITPKGDTMEIVHEIYKNWFKMDELEDVPIVFGKGFGSSSMIIRESSYHTDEVSFLENAKTVLIV